MLCKGFDARIQIGGRTTHNRNIDITITQHLHHLIAVTYFNLNLQAEVFFAKARQELRYKIFSGTDESYF